jgi:hypothetical protein
MSTKAKGRRNSEFPTQASSVLEQMGEKFAKTERKQEK